MQTDVKAKNMTATGAASVGPCRVKAIQFKPSAAGSIVLRKGGASGTVLLTLDTDTASTTYMCFPGEGILFPDDVHVTLTTVASMTFFYG